MRMITEKWAVKRSINTFVRVAPELDLECG